LQKTLEQNAKIKAGIFKNKGVKINQSDSIVKEYFSTRNKSQLCFAPEKNLFFGIDGTISSCYAQSYILSYGKYPELSISEAWNSSTAIKIRKQVKNLYLPPACNLCFTQIMERNFDVTYAGVYDQHEANTDFPIAMEFYLDNTCNLECIMCNPESSSLHAKKQGIKKQKSPYDDKFVDELQKYIPHLKHTYFFGGEPFLIPIYYEIWEQIVNHNPNCIIDITTNGSILNDKVKSILSKGKFNINISIDSLQKETFESIRKNADFDLVMENLKYFKDYCKKNNTKFFISFCALQKNRMEIPDILEFANNIDAGLVYNRVWSPYSSALWTLKPDKLKETSEYLDKFKFTPKNEIQHFNIKGFNTLKAQIKKWHNDSIKDSPKDNITIIKIKEYISNELKACFKNNRKNSLSFVKSTKDLSQRISLIDLLIDVSNFSQHEKLIFNNNIRMQRSYFINALLFAKNKDKVKKIINLAKT
jgi:MoaA/NifB/PqqE/SkfB family radical SAM enzyme